MQKRIHRYTIRFSKDENDIVIEKAKHCGLEPSVMIRQLTIKKEIKARLSDEERGMHRQLVGMANNINELTKAVHIGGVLPLIEPISTTLELHNNIINQYKK